MRKTALFLLPILLLLSWSAAGQSSRDEVLADPAKAGGLMYVYDYTAEPPVTPAPKGYKPFYVSHIGRHGARYVLGMQYDTLAACLGRAARENLLNERGKQLLRDYQSYYLRVFNLEGTLTGKGAEQERTIGRRLYRRYPQLFKGPTRGVAFSTPSSRVVLSMTSYIDGLQSMDKDLSVDARSAESFSVFLRPNWSTLNRERPVPREEINRPYPPYFLKTVDVQGIMGRVFTDPDAAVERAHIHPVDFITVLMSLVGEQHCVDEPSTIFDGLMTLEDRIAYAQARAYYMSLTFGHFQGSPTLFPDFAAYTVRDFIERADEDSAAGDLQLRLRFTHDSSIMPLMVYLDINGLGRYAATPEEAFEIYPNWKLPMGASLHLVFFRNKKGDILVKALFNEQEATLPFPALQGPYYRWNDFKSYYGERIAKTVAELEKLPPKAHPLERYGLAAESPM